MHIMLIVVADSETCQGQHALAFETSVLDVAAHLKPLHHAP